MIGENRTAIRTAIFNWRFGFNPNPPFVRFFNPNPDWILANFGIISSPLRHSYSPTMSTSTSSSAVSTEETKHNRKKARNAQATTHNSTSWSGIQRWTRLHQERHSSSQRRRHSLSGQGTGLCRTTGQSTSPRSSATQVHTYGKCSNRASSCPWTQQWLHHCIGRSGNSSN